MKDPADGTLRWIKESAQFDSIDEARDPAVLTRIYGALVALRKGDASAKLPYQGSPGFGKVAEVFNDLVEHLRRPIRRPHPRTRSMARSSNA